MLSGLQTDPNINNRITIKAFITIRDLCHLLSALDRLVTLQMSASIVIRCYFPCTYKNFIHLSDRPDKKIGTGLMEPTDLQFFYRKNILQSILVIKSHQYLTNST